MGAFLLFCIGFLQILAFASPSKGALACITTLHLEDNFQSVNKFENGRLTNYTVNLHKMELVEQSELIARWKIPLENAKESGLHLVGYQRDKEGKIIPIYSDRKGFQSVRQGLGDLAWHRFREAVILPVDWKTVPVDDHQDASTKYSNLPKILAEKFEKNMIPQIISSPNSNTEWSVLMMKNGDYSGRTGVLLFNGMPLVFQDPVSNNEWILETKGIGQPNGGISKDEQYGLRGGLYRIQGERERRELNGFYSELGQGSVNGVFSIGLVAWKDRNLNSSEKDDYDPSLLLRLTPTTMRLSFEKINSLPQKPKIEKLAYGYGKIYGEFMGRGLIPFSHPENILWNPATNELTMTDFGDVIGLERLPIRWGNRDRDVESIYDSLLSVTQIKGFEENQSSAIQSNHFESFKRGLVESLRETISNFSENQWQTILSSENFEQLYKNLWNRVLNRIAFERRLLSGYIPFKLSLRSYLPAKSQDDLFSFVTKGNIRKSWFDRDDVESEFSKKVTTYINSPVEYTQECISTNQTPSKHEVDQFISAVKQISSLVEESEKNYRDRKQGFLNLIPQLALIEQEFAETLPGLIPLIFAPLLFPKNEAISALHKEIEFLTPISAYEPTVNESLQFAKKQLAFLQTMSATTYLSKFSEEPFEILNYSLLPYHLKNIRINTDIRRQDGFSFFSPLITKRMKELGL